MIVLEIVILICVFFTAISIVIGSMKTGIPPMPTSGRVCRAMMSFAENSGTGPLIDLGSGWGTIVIALARKYPDRQIIGYELSLVPWFVSLALKHILRLNNLELYRQNFLEADLSNASVLLCYLFPAVMASLQEKLELEATNEMLIVSNTFALPSWKPVRVKKINDMHGSLIYQYRSKLKSE